MIDKLAYFFTGTLKRQLISSVALVHAVLMALFIWDLTERHKELLLERQVDQAQTLVQSIATSSAGWVSAKDYYGLQEIIAIQSQYSELAFAMILDKEGKILAHTDVSHLSEYVSDLPSAFKAQLLSSSSHLVDAIHPIVLAKMPIGWVRVGLVQKKTAEKLREITLDGILYAIIAIIIGSLLAFVMASRLTKRLRNIQACADAVKTGELELRADVVGNDEISHVSTAFNTMLDSMIEARQRVDIARNAVHLGIFDYNIQTQDLIWDNWMFRIYGLSKSQFRGTFECWSNNVHPNDIEQAKYELESALKGEKSFNTEFRIIKPDRSIRWIKADATIIENDHGKPVRMIGVNQDITEKKEKEKLIERQANYDHLTLLPNRKLFHELLVHEIEQAKRGHLSVWLLYLDLDGFKEVNDTLGHHMGDELLIQLVKRLESHLRSSDTIARLGGDEFVIILTCVEDLAYVDHVAAKLLKIVAESFWLNDTEVFVSTSIGIASYPDDADNSDDLIKFADQSMYVSKKEGKNRYVYFTPELQKASQVRIELTGALRKAISQNEFQLYYQPIVNLSNKKVYKAEALIRWIHPEKGFISPAAFIPLAEETGTICEIGSWIFDTAFSTLQKWKKIHSSFQLSINMSPYQLRVSKNKYDNWLDKLDSHVIDGSSVVIEITEGILLKNETLVKERLLEYRTKGVQVAIDDFGTGYSSLSYLKEFNIDYLKIDQSFVRNLKKGSSEYSLSEAIIVMAHKLGLEVIAEGIETQEQLDLLTEMDCDYGQGYLFSRPIETTRFEEQYIHTWEH